LPDYPAVDTFKSFNCNEKSQQQNLTQVARCFLFCKCWENWHCHSLHILR